MKGNKFSISLFIVLFFGVTGIVRADILKGLVAHYPFDGNANDVSGNEHHGTAVGAISTSDRFGNSNSAYHFDGLGYVEVSDSESLHINESFAVSVWIKQELPEIQDCIISHVQSAMSGYQLCSSVDSLGFGYYYNQSSWQTGSNGVLISPVAVDNLWHHIVSIYRTVNSEILLQIYKDGLKINEKSYPGNEKILWATGNLYIGTNLHGVGSEYRGFNGYIDDLKIYDRSLSETEIQELYWENNQAYQAGRQSCIDEPNSCGIKPKVVVVPLR